MKRMISLFLCLCAMVAQPRAAQPDKCVALIFMDAPGVTAQTLLEGLQQRQIHATFFIDAARAVSEPEIVEKLFRDGHELGIQISARTDGVPKSRRTLAQDMVDTRALLPGDSKTEWLLPADGCTDAARQVARAKNLAVLELGASEDVILIRAFGAPGALAAVDALGAEGYQFVTLSELARLRGVKITPGEIYRDFPIPPILPYPDTQK